MSMGPSNVVHRELEALDLNCEILSVVTDFLGGASAALRQHIAQALAFGYLFHHRQNIIGIALSQLAPIEVF